jgi:flavin reductase (DIM6/NTAB) family NADH-FMN oxidoreductase RutF
MSTFYSFAPGEIPQPKLHGFLIGAVAPRPIALASTIDAQGRPNLAPFSFFNVFSSNPPICIFSPARRGRDGTLKHTYDNVMATGEVVINVVTWPMLHQVNLASVEFPEGVNEFEQAGFTPFASESVKPFRVAESPVQMECRVIEVKQLGTGGGAGNLVICEVVRMHIAQEMLTPEGGLRLGALDLVGRMGRDFWVRAHGEAMVEIEKALPPPVIGWQGLPEQVRNSAVLTGNELAQLANMTQLPTEAEVSAFLAGDASQEMLKGISNAEELHRMAQARIHAKDKPTAWLLLMAERVLFS